MDRQVSRRMIDKNHPSLPVGAQCRLLSISRSSFFHELMGGDGHEPRPDVRITLQMIQNTIIAAPDGLRDFSGI